MESREALLRKITELLEKLDKEYNWYLWVFISKYHLFNRQVFEKLLEGAPTEELEYWYMTLLEEIGRAVDIYESAKRDLEDELG